MSLDWGRIEEADTEEAGLWRLVDELHQSEASDSDMRRIRRILRFGNLPEDVRACLRDALRRDPRRSTQRIEPIWSGSAGDIAPSSVEPPTQGLSGLHAAVATHERLENPVDTQVLDDDEIRATWSDLEPPAGISATESSSLVARPTPELMRLVPVGPHRLKFGASIYEGVDELSILELLRRGILLGSEIDTGGGRWIRVIDHPAFDGLIETMGNEMNRVIARRGSADVVDEVTRPAAERESLREATLRREDAGTDEITRPSTLVPETLEEDSADLVPEGSEEPNDLHSQDISAELAPSIRRALDAMSDEEPRDSFDTEVLDEQDFDFTDFASLDIEVEELDFAELDSPAEPPPRPEVQTEVLESREKVAVHLRPSLHANPNSEYGQAQPRQHLNSASLPAVPPAPSAPRKAEHLAPDPRESRVSREQVDTALLRTEDPREKSAPADEHSSEIGAPAPRTFEDDQSGSKTWPLILIAILILAALALATVLAVLAAQGKIFQGVLGVDDARERAAVSQACDAIEKDAALVRIDQLVAEHGSDAVLIPSD